MEPARKFPGGTQPNMFAIALFVVFGSAIGAVAVSAFVVGLYSLLEPSWSKDGQAVLAYILSVPIGTVLGGTFGYVRIKYETSDRTAGYVLSLVGGVTTFICLGIGISSASTRGFSVLEFILTIASPWVVAPLIASLIMLIRGVLVLKG
jgi:hypothetical protein